MKRTLLIALLLALCLLCACGTAPAPAATPTPEPTPEPTPIPTPTPTPEPVDVTLPDGRVISIKETTALDLHTLKAADAEATAEILKQLPNLKTIDLGRQGEGEIGWKEVGLFQSAFPEADVNYGFELWGKSFTTLDEKMDFNHIEMDDQGAAVREVLPYMTRCTYLDMDFCSVDSEHMAAIRDENPGMEVVWRIWFGLYDKFSVRTDCERILASNFDSGLNTENTQELKYCTKVKYLDVGHQNIDDISFLGYMPDLEICVISLYQPWRDLSPIANCTKLEWLEIELTQCDDIAPLAALKNLKHLDMTNLANLAGADFTPLHELTQLERLFIAETPITPEELEALQAALPNTEIVTRSMALDQPGGWKYQLDGKMVPYFEHVYEAFDYKHYNSAASYAKNDPLYYPHEEELPAD